MVARAGGYYGTAFQGAYRVRQGDPPPPTIFNVVVDAVVRNWVTVEIAGAEERGERGKEGRHHASLFYADDGMVASSDPCWLQSEFNTLVGLFDRVGLRTNIGKTVGMVCRPCQAAGNQLEAAYGRRITGEGPTYRECQKGRVHCRECGEEMAAGSMAGHTMTQHGQAAEARQSWKTSTTGEEPQKYLIAFPDKGGPRSCPVEGFLGRATTRMTMQLHLLHLHVLDTVVILEEGNLPHPRIP